MHVTIPLPVIVPPQYFKIRYRAIGAGSWTNFANQDNDPFTITGLTPGNYEMEATLVLADGTECNPAIYTFTVKDYECLEDIEAEIILDADGTYKIHLTYTIPPGILDPPCYWETVWYQLPSGTPVTNAWPILPTEIKIPIGANVPHHLTFRAHLCEGQYLVCFDEDIPAAPQPPCDPMQSLAYEILASDHGEYYLQITFQNSNPPTTNAQYYYRQYGGMVSGIPQPYVTGYVPISSSQTQLIFLLHPNLNVSPDINNVKVLRYQGYIVDGCGVQHNFFVARVL